MDFMTLSVAKSYTDKKFEEIENLLTKETSEILSLLGDDEDEQDQ